MLRPVLAGLLLAANIVAAVSVAASAENYPTNTVRIVVPTAPGGPLDVLGRLITEPLRESFG
jgi:tripartite-type tricarboxylate transporter receptor subunit TctC